MMNDFAGVDLEKQVDHVVAYVEPYIRARRQQSQRGIRDPPGADAGAGHFTRPASKQFIRDTAAAIEEHNGRKIFVHREDGHEVAVGFVAPDLIAVGQADLVRRALDISAGARRVSAKTITTNSEMMTLIRDSVGQHRMGRRPFRCRQPPHEASRRVGGQVPPVRLVSVKANINGGVKAAIRAEAGDKAAAEQLRDVVRGFISLARLQAGAKPEFESTLKSIELSGTDKTVRLSFAVSPETLRVIAPLARPRPPAFQS